MSISAHLLAYNGRNDHLFRSAILDSGSPGSFSRMSRSYQPLFHNLTITTNCSTAVSPLSCLRAMPYATLNAILNTTAFSSGWSPAIDGDIIATHPSTQLSTGAFVHVPIIAGTNTDEGTSFSPMAFNTTSDWTKALTSNTALTPSYAAGIISNYTSLPYNQLSLPSLPPTYTFPVRYGPLWRYTSTYYGDTSMHAGRRLLTSTYSAAGVPTWSYRFNAIPAWAYPEQGATHFVEVAFAMLSFEGIGYPPVRARPFEGKSEAYFDLARSMASAYVGFVNGGVPGGERGVWPEYGMAGKEGQGRNYVFEAERSSWVESDDWRREEIEWINEHGREVYDH
jgi:carboxylesterase type B